LHRRGHRRFVVVATGQAHPSQHLPGRGVGDFDDPAAPLSPLTGDTHPGHGVVGETERLQDLVHRLSSVARLSATTSISIKNPPGRAPAWTADRAGGWSPKYSA